MFNLIVPRTIHPVSRARGQRAGLRPEDVIAAARQIAGRDGLGAVTMRRLADELGVAPNSIYSYFPDKAALLDAVLDDVIGEIAPPAADPPAWRDGIVVLLGQTRSLLLEHAELIPLFLTRPTRGRNAIRLGEVTLELLARGGIEGERAVQALRALLVFTFGFAALEAPRLADAQPDRRRADAQSAFEEASEEFPHMARLAPLLAREPSDEDFEAGVRWVLAGIERQD